jgi:hypothetical protein
MQGVTLCDAIAKGIMKKLAVLFLACSLTIDLATAANPTEADQKWLQAVEKMVSKGQAKVSTSDESRLALLKEWLAKNGYSAKVSKLEKTFVVEVAKRAADARVAQN